MGLKLNVMEINSEEIANGSDKMFYCSIKKRFLISSMILKINGIVSILTEKSLGKLLRFYNYPCNIRKSLKSTDAIERLNEEIRRRVKAVSIP